MHLCACNKAIRYFFSSGHTNYARYGISYLRKMEILPRDILYSFLKSQQILDHQERLGNEIWSDMMIDNTYIQYGKGPDGIIAVTKKPRSVQLRPNSLPVFKDLMIDFDNLREQNLVRKIKRKK